MSITKTILRGLLSAAIVFGLASAPAGAAAPHTDACLPHGAHVASTHGALRVFTAGDGAAREIRGCWGSHRRAIDFGPIHDLSEYGAVESNTVMATRGSCVAVQQHLDDGHGADGYFLNVFDLRSRRAWSYGSSINAQTDPGQRSNGSTTIGAVVDVVLGDGCAVAWTNANRLGGAAQVRKADADGRVRLAQATDIDLRSLTLSGTTLTWTQAGAPATASLSGTPRGSHSAFLPCD